jgi:ATP-dependent Clp protease ATP-binding subunit ClpA
MHRIVDIQLKQVQKRLLPREINLTWSPEVADSIAKLGYDPAFGARPLKRLIQRKVTNLLSKMLLEGAIVPHSDVTLVLSDGELDFVTKPKSA